MSTEQQLAKARAAYLAHPTNLGLRRYLMLKGRLGRWDRRMHLYYGVATDVTHDVKRCIARAYGRGLVPTSTTGGKHAPGSFHFQHRAADLGLRKEEIGTAKGMRRMVRFQTAEFRRFQRRGIVELIGPDETITVLRGSSTRLADGSALETAHDNHVHVAF